MWVCCDITCTLLMRNLHREAASDESAGRAGLKWTSGLGAESRSPTHMRTSTRCLKSEFWAGGHAGEATGRRCCSAQCGGPERRFASYSPGPTLCRDVRGGWVVGGGATTTTHVVPAFHDSNVCTGEISRRGKNVGTVFFNFLREKPPARPRA